MRIRQTNPIVLPASLLTFIGVLPRSGITFKALRIKERTGYASNLAKGLGNVVFDLPGKLRTAHLSAGNEVHRRSVFSADCCAHRPQIVERSYVARNMNTFINVLSPRIEHESS